MEKKSNSVDLVSRQIKKVPTQPKGKINKTKTIGVKSKVKGVNVKRVKKSTFGKQKTNPAPIVEAGYSLYSTTSDDSVAKEQDTYSRVLTLLKERHKKKGVEDIRTAVQDHGSDTTLTDVELPPAGKRTNKTLGTTSTGSCSRSHPPPIHIPFASNDPRYTNSNTPFNNRLLSSTPDPECLVRDRDNLDHSQLIPERDTSSTLWHHLMRSGVTNHPQYGAAINPEHLHGFSVNPGYNSGSFDNPGSSTFQDAYLSHMSQGIKVPSAYSVPLQSDLFDSHMPQQAVPQTQSLGFLPSQDPFPGGQNSDDIMRRESDIEALRAFIPCESAGFIPPSLLARDSGPQQKSSSSSGEQNKTSSTPGFNSTPDTTSSGYVTLPKPKGQGQQGKVQQGTVPVLTQQNGLYQLHSGTQQKPLMEQYITGQARYPSPVPNAGTQNFEGSYLSGQHFDIPEKDEAPANNPMAIPIMNLPDGMSSISGTPSSQRTTVASSLTPHSDVTPRNSSSSSGAKSVHFENVENVVNEQHLSQNSDTGSKNKSSQTQTDVCDLHLEPVPAEGHLMQGTSLNRKPDFSPVVNHQPVNAEVSSIQQILQHPWLGQEHINQGQGHICQGHMLTPSSNVMTTQMTVTPSPASNVSSGIHSGSKDQSSGMGSSVYSDVPNPWSQVKTEAGLKKLRYFLKELKECGKMKKKSEVGRLVKEVEKTLETIPQLKSTFSLQAEINLAIQPLRSENAQLRRKVRLLTQQARDFEIAREKANSSGNIDFEVLHLQSSNSILQKQIAEEKESRVKLAGEITELLSQIQKMKTEKNKLLASLSEKEYLLRFIEETGELEIRQECLKETQKLRQELDTLRRQIQGSQVRHDSLEQENHILQITLQQRDSEIRRLQEIVDTVKESVAQLLQELEVSRTQGENSFMSTNSFGLQKLLQVLGEDPGNNTQKTIRSDPGLKSPPKHQVKSRLTAEALATHNEIQKSRNPTLDPYRGSTSDTEVELNMMDRNDNIRRKSPKLRRRSLSTEGQQVSDLRRYQDGNRILNGQTGNYSDARNDVRKYSNRNDVGRFLPQNNGQVDNSYVPHGKGQRLRQSEEESRFNVHNDLIDNRMASIGQRFLSRNDYDLDKKSDVDFSKFSTADSRYSVTDYFKKYPQSKPSDSIQNNRQAKLSDKITGFQQLSDRSFNEDKRITYKPHRRSLSQPESHKFDHSTQPMYTPKKPSFYNEEETKTKSHVTSPQERLFRGTQLDNSISAIDEDNISSVSEQTKSTTSTLDDKTFRKGIATLDANILKLQLALHKTKSMLS